MKFIFGTDERYTSNLSGMYLRTLTILTNICGSYSNIGLNFTNCSSNSDCFQHKSQLHVTLHEKWTIWWSVQQLRFSTSNASYYSTSCKKCIMLVIKFVQYEFLLKYQLLRHMTKITRKKMLCLMNLWGLRIWLRLKVQEGRYKHNDDCSLSDTGYW